MDVSKKSESVKEEKVETKETKPNDKKDKSFSRSRRGRPPMKGKPPKSDKPSKPSDGTPKPAPPSGSSPAASPASEISDVTTRLNPFFFDSPSEMVFGRIAYSGYLRLVLESYKMFCDMTPRVQIHMSQIEWAHMHMILFVKRIQDVHARIIGAKFPKEVNAIVPDRLQVFSPIWETLHCLGLVDDELIATRWLPVMEYPTNDDYEVDKLYNYDWNESWRLVLRARKRREEMRQTHFIASRRHVVDIPFRHPGEPPSSEESSESEEGEEEEESKATISAEGILKPKTKVPEDVPESWEDKEDESDFLSSRQLDYERTKPEFLEADPDAGLTAVSMHGKNLHWDPKLWKDYRELLNEIPKETILSIDIPKTPDGNYGWVLQVSSDAGGYTAWAPHNKVQPVASFFAVLLDFSAFEKEQKSRFVVKSTAIRDPLVLMLKWIHAFCPNRRTY